ncbi:NXPE family member 1-like [Hyperolius riggenbachi]|uniref:NXPE family member 1-like n=1 Tax=Hyperolius riggenbachi TaxID=752182 RepID=UPI0035A26174
MNMEWILAILLEMRSSNNPRFRSHKDVMKSFSCLEDSSKLPHFQSLQTGISVIHTFISSAATGHNVLEEEVQHIFNFVNSSIPNVVFANLSETSNSAKSIAMILNYKPRYCIGDTIIAQVHMFNYLGEGKTYGGDFLRPRIFSPNLGAGASGRVEDFNNGTYNVYFTLFWEGLVNISLLLMHPSEGVSALWKERNQGNRHFKFKGKFLNQSQEVHTECGFQLDSQGQRCKYGDDQSGDYFYCMKLPGVPCEAFVSLNTEYDPQNYLTSMEQQLFTGSNFAIEIPKRVDHIEVVKCKNQPVKAAPRCKTGVPLTFPSGYFLNNLWHPLHCDVSSYERLAKINTCLSGKFIYIMGDSTLHYWMRYFPKLLNSLQVFHSQHNVWHETHSALDMTSNIFIRWKKHGHPFLVLEFVNVRDYADVAHQINQIGGDADTVIVFTVGFHFRPFPISVFIRRLLSIRKAIQNMLLRSPDTKIIVKTENTVEKNVNPERFSDFHGYIQYLLVKKIFSGLNIGMIDAWDMTVAFGSYALHPQEIILKNQINMLLSYLC